MPRLVSVEEARRDPAYVLPDHKPGVIALERIVTTQLLEQLDAWSGMCRTRGHQARALFTSAVLFLSAGPLGGIRPFLQAIRARARSRFGALVGVRSIATASALSRALSDLEHDQVRPFVSSLLKGSVDAALLNHPAVLHHDALGGGWHLADLDPTVHAIRRRDLPEGEDLPEGKRRAKGEPGYVGRKRGEARQRLIPVMHDGAGVWLAMWLVAEEGSIVDACAGLMKATMDTLSEHAGAHGVIGRGDGEFGSAGAIRAIIDSGAHPLVRLTRYALIDREQVVAHLREVGWCPMRPGESGVKREAAELGTFTLRGSTDSDREAVVTVRVVVTRFLRESAPTHGVKRNGYQLELFATTLDPVAWPAPDVAELYAGRATIENRFAQEDREFNLERTFSFHPPGQEWVCGVALFLWNELVRAGVCATPLPADGVVQASRPPRPLELEPHAAVDRREDNEQIDPAPTPEVVAEAPVTPSDVDDARAALGGIMSRVYAELGPGWRVEPERAQLRCPEGRRLLAFSATGPSKAGGPRLAARSEPWACDGCRIRANCFPGTGPYKQLTRTIGEDDLASATRALRTVRAATPPMARGGRGAVPHPPPTTPRSEPMYAPPIAAEAGPLYSERPRFLAAAARRAIREQTRAREILLRVSRPLTRRRPRFHPLIAADAAARAHRRKTRAQALAQNRVERHFRMLSPPGTTQTGDSHVS
jgi:hypothetical protein